jgi:hypothetical protein
MKKFYLSLSFILLLTLSFAAPVNTLVNHGGLWRIASNWSLNRIPAGGDTIVIPAGKLVTIDNNFSIDPNKLFIKVAGTLNVAGVSAKLIIGTGSYIWIYNTGVVMGSGNSSEIIKIGGNIVFKGNDPSVSGPVTASATSNGFQSSVGTPLPARFINYSVVRENNNVLVQWTTTEETNSSMYELERSFNGSDWTTIAYISAVRNTNVVNNYSYTDKNVAAKIAYYRIKQVDVNGRFAYTPVKSIRIENTNTEDVAIAAIAGKVVLQFGKEIKGNVIVRIVSLAGQLSEQKIITNAFGQIVLDANVKGCFVIAVSNGQDVNVARQVIL